MSLWLPSMPIDFLRRRPLASLCGALVLAFVSSTVVAQEEYTPIRRLGTSNAISRPGPQTRDDLQQVFEQNRADYEKVLREAGWPGNPEDLFRAVANGDFSEAQYPVGHTFEWMAVRKRGVAQPTGPIRWDGRDPFEAFEIRFESNDMRHRFLIPKACGNLALVDMREPDFDITAFVPTIRVQSPNNCTGTTATVDVTVPSGGVPEGGRLELTMTRPNGQRETLNPTQAGGGYRWQGQLDDAGAYTFSATVVHPRGRTQAVTERLNLEPCEPTCNIQLTRPPMDPTPKAGRASVGIDMCQSSARTGSIASRTVQIHHTPLDGPEALIETLSLDAECSADYLLPEYGSYRFAAEVTDDRGMSATCQADYTLVKPEALYGPFFTLFGGNERRWRSQPVDDVLANATPEQIANGEAFLFDRSAALAGGTFGWMFPIADGAAGVFAQGGVAINLRDSENTSVFADVGIDKMWEKGFLGAGVGVWDFNHSDTTEGSIIVHGGFNITERLQFNIEGRLFMDKLDMIGDNFVYLAGIRFFLRE